VIGVYIPVDIFKDVKFLVILLQSACQLVINEVDDDDDECII